MRPCRQGSVLVVAVVAVSGAAIHPARADDPVVRLDLDVRRFDRRIPSSTPFVLELRAPGKEALRGQLEVWPAVDATCTTLPTSGRQHHTLALLPSGDDAARVLRATVPPLQVDTHFCFAVRVIRGLDDLRAIGFAADVTARLFSSSPAVPAADRVNVDDTCGQPGARARFAAAIGKAAEHVAGEQLEHTRQAVDLAPLDLRPAVTTSDPAGAAPARPAADAPPAPRATFAPAITARDRQDTANALGQTVVDGLDVEGLCATLGAAGRGRDRLAAAGALAEAELARAVDVVPRSLAVSAPLPLFIGPAPSFTVRRYDRLLAQDADLEAAAIALEERYPAVAAALHAVHRATAPAARDAAYDAYRALLRTLRPAPVELAYVGAAGLATAPLAELFPARGPGEPEADWRARRARPLAQVLASRELLKRQLGALVADDPHARDWLDAIDVLERADLAYSAAGAALKGAFDTVEGARQAFTTGIKNRLLAADVRALVTSVNAFQVGTPALRSSGTESAVSPVSPDLGVMIAFPLGFDRADDHDATTPWVVPYGGVNIYLEGVDRTIAFDELVRPWRQRLSLTVGALLARPKVNGVAISTPFRDSGAVVPMVALGYRLTSFTRASAGGFLFEYQDANPASVAKHRAGALWIGLSIDADLWSVAAGKAFR